MGLLSSYFFYLSYPKTMHAKHAKTKSTKKWIVFPIIFLVWICCYLVINARDLIFTDISDTNSNLKWRFSWIHFTSLWNDFGGGVFWEVWSTSTTNTVTISLDGVDKCWTQQVKWLYYNNARGARLWPLDQDTLNTLKATNSSYDNLSMEGWFYRDCSANGDVKIVYWYIKYTLGGDESSLIAGVKLDYDKNEYKPEFAKNLQYFNNNTPLGYIWDSYGGIWFLWGKLAWTWCADLLEYLNTWSIQNAFHLDTDWVVQLNGWFTNNCTRTPSNGKSTDMWNLLIQWNTILSTTVSSWEKTALLWALEEKTVLLSSSDINSSTVMNAAKKNAGSLCRWKTLLNNTDGHIINDDATNNDVLCYENAPNLVLNLADWTYEGKTIIVNSWNINLIGTMEKDAPAMDMFVDRWSVYLKALVGGEFSTFNIQWFPTTISGDIKNEWRFLKGNFVINWLLLWGEPGTISSITNKLHVYGKFVSLNTPLTVNTWREEQIEDILGSNAYLNRISFKNSLTWTCKHDGKWTDWSEHCWSDSAITSIPFVVLDWNFASKIIK